MRMRVIRINGSLPRLEIKQSHLAAQAPFSLVGMDSWGPQWEHSSHHGPLKVAVITPSPA